MLKELLSIIEAEETISPEMQKNFNRTAVSIRKAMKPWVEQREVLSVATTGQNKATYTIEFNHWLREETIGEVCKEIEDAIKKSDVNGHIHKIEDHSSGEQSVEALLSGLRRGMKLVPEAFFPTIEFVVTWQIVTRRPSR